MVKCIDITHYSQKLYICTKNSISEALSIWVTFFCSTNFEKNTVFDCCFLPVLCAAGAAAYALFPVIVA